MTSSANSLSKVEHIVVLMLENRSFDNLLGWLYDPANDAPFNLVPRDFEGLYGKNLSNRAPDGRVVPAGKTDDARSPQPNPGEPFEDVYSQIYNVPKVDFNGSGCPSGNNQPDVPHFAALLAERGANVLGPLPSWRIGGAASWLRRPTSPIRRCFPICCMGKKPGFGVIRPIRDKAL